MMMVVMIQRDRLYAAAAVINCRGWGHTLAKCLVRDHTTIQPCMFMRSLCNPNYST